MLPEEFTVDEEPDAKWVALFKGQRTKEVPLQFGDVDPTRA